jgi:hypothetical protein
MGSKGNSANAHDEEWQYEETEPPDQERQDRTLVLMKEPLPRKVQLMSAGVREIRCICCGRIRPIAGAEELGEGWICGECLSEVTENRKYGGQQGK